VYEVAKSSGAKIVCVTSGGKLKERAEADGHVVYVVPGGLSPRAALGYMLIPVVHACQSLKLIPEQDFEAAFAALGRCREALRVEESDNPAKAIAQHLAGSLTLVYGLAGYKGLIANRWRSQLNENAKHLAFANSYPELDHNEIVGWIGAEKQSVGRFAGVLLEDGSETEKMRRRVEVTERLLEGKCRFHHVRAEGESLLERMLWLTYFGDWVSIYLARLNEQDPVDIAPIDTLKEQLAKVG
jgi:glucose/mannose-6-phosphate isomerase